MIDDSQQGMGLNNKDDTGGWKRKNKSKGDSGSREGTDASPALARATGAPGGVRGSDWSRCSDNRSVSYMYSVRVFSDEWLPSRAHCPRKHWLASPLEELHYYEYLHTL